MNQPETQTMTRHARRIAQTLGLAILLALPALAQNNLTPQLTPLPLKGSLSDIPSAPTPVDKDGKPIQPKPPTPAEMEIQRKEREQRDALLRAEESRLAADAARRSQEESRSNAQLAEQQTFHGHVMSALYIGLAIVAVGVGSRLLKRRA